MRNKESGRPRNFRIFLSENERKKILSLPESSNDTARRFGVEMVFNYTDGTTKKFYANFSPDSLDWQFLSALFIPEKDYSSFTISYAYCHQLNDAWFTGLSLFLEEFGQTYAYDDKDRVTSSLDIQKNETKFEYSNANDLTGVTDPKGKKCME